MHTRLVAIRHAKPVSEGNGDETLRILSEEGRAKQKQRMQELLDDGIVPELILCSPLIRARQTAEIVSEFSGNVPIKIHEALGYDFNKDALLTFVNQYAKNKTVFFVGHSPTLSDFVNKLAGKNVTGLGLPVSGTAIIEFPDNIEFGAGTLVGLYTG